MSEKKCCVPGCVESGRSHRVLHLFPNPEKDMKRFNLWLMAIRGDFLGLDDEYIYRRRRVCHAHFDQKHCCRLDRISNIAVPTQNIPDPLQLPDSINSKESRLITQIQQSSECLPSTSRDKAMDVGLQKPAHKDNIPINPVHCELTLEQKFTDNEFHEDRNLQKQKGQVVQKTSGKTLDNVVHTKKKHFKTVTEQQLYSKLIRLRVKLSKLKSAMRKQSATLKAARHVTSNEKFRMAMQDLPSAARILTMMQFRGIKKKDKGRRFSLDEKIFSLALFKQSAKYYRFLRKILILPAPQTLVKLLQQANVQPGPSQS